VHRLSFFKTPPNETPSGEDFLGYVIYKVDEFTGDPKIFRHVYECVIAPFRGPSRNNFIHCLRTYEVRNAAGLFAVRGILYARQNDLTFVCAHVALRTALSAILPSGDISYEDINNLVGVDHVSRTVGGGSGLGPDQFEAIFKGLGLSFEKIIHEPSQGLTLPTEFQRDLYGFVESGFPALMGFELDPPPGATNGSRHVIPVFGHTFNEDTWLPNAQRAYFGGDGRYYPSENWLSTFLVHDDNFGPYYCLPRSFLKQEKFRLIYGIHLEALALRAAEAEAIGFSYIDAIAKSFRFTGQGWYDRFVIFCRSGWLVLRTILVQKAAYLSHLNGLRDWDERSLEPESISILESHLPGKFWLIEASATELFASSRRKFGEVLLAADKTMPKPLDTSLLIAGRLPGMYFVNQTTGFGVTQTQLQGHSALFSTPLRNERI
jgi:hypothetical protein